ncbi:hypothetical protein TSUD_304150 [Trifolium subterraneum]|uniref:Reverse transcriptase domain-containing protein n=1 Tax=Trifolium subterraneum TaxID=3900 RepID=A0A2Z6MBU2_TRISU|nr:hypothetical protein TSUD_304150 [Trifolium subterraneum]
MEDEQWGEWRLTCYYGYPERSRRRAAWGSLTSFRQAVSDCDLTDITIEGHPFTWIKSRGTPHVIEEKLDKAMVSTSWLQLFPQVRLSNLLASHSDHSPILLQCKPIIRTQINHSFRFENSWLKEPDLEDVVVEGWGGGENLEVVDRVTRCANKLQRWGKKKRIRFKEEIDECVRRMNELRGNQDEEGSMQYQELSERHATLLIQEEGKKKKVTKLIADNGTEAHTQEELCEVVKSYFDTLFKPRDGDHDPVLNLIQPRVTDNDNFVLTAPITKVEIQQALFQMHPDKSPGPDEFNPAFYQRLILDNALIATEVIHALKRKTQGRRGELTLKIDISKAYNKVDWDFLRRVMTKMGFTDVWIRWVMMCVSSVNYSVLRNSDQVGPISPGRGLRQGDPLSPYLFILVTECLIALIHQAVGRGDLHGVRICRGAPEVSHLLFADDCFLFCRANVAEVNELMRILHTYQTTSGGRLGVGIIFVLCITLGCVGVLIDGCPRLNQQMYIRCSGEDFGLVSSVREDKVVWEEERNGCYSVKSGGCLPTRSRLLERRVECTLNCPVCDEEIEDELHIFFRCAVAQDSWSAAGLSSVLHNAMYQQTNVMDRIFAVCNNESSDTVGRVAMLLWCIWHNRNDKLWNDNVQMPRQIGRHAFDAWNDWYSMPRQIGRHAFDAWNDWYSVHKLQSNNVSGTTEADLVRWEKPALDWVKCNVDVAFVSGSGRISVGLCFRDNSGHFMAEATLSFCQLFSDILSLMSSFINFEVKFVRRQTNLVAHTLARAANSWADFHRFENIPFCIEQLVFNEMHGVGSIMYNMVCSRSDLSYAISVGGLRYKRIDPGRDDLEGYVDADYAEYIALVEGVKEAIWLKGMIGEMGIGQGCVRIHCHSQSVIHLANHQVYHERTKHIYIRLHFVRDRIETKEIIVEKVASEENSADMFTKSIPRAKFKHCLDLINFEE